MIKIDNFDDLRPYRDDEINSAMCRIAKNPLFAGLARYLYPDKNIDDVRNMLRSINTVADFQREFMYYAISRTVKNTISDFTFSGLENLNKNNSYLYISNHRDILLDSALLLFALYNNGFATSEITFGSNLMISELVIDIGKSNKMFKVIRGGTPREFLNNSARLSQYIRHTITHKNESIWIAQRNGRTKDGNDQTDQGIMKMFAMSGKNGFADSLAELNITPMVVSYQWETCDVAKVREAYISKTQKYVKAPGEDLQSILNGITQYKGKVHISILPTFKKEDFSVFDNFEKNEKYSLVTDLITRKMHLNYKLWDTNFIAYDIENDSNSYRDKEYSGESYDYFVNQMNEKLSSIDGDFQELRKIYLGIYSNPVKNILKYI